MTAPEREVPRDDPAITGILTDPLWRSPRGFGWLLLFSGSLSAVFVIAIGVTVWRGIGMWGNNIPVAWGFGITNFVWWIGIGHAGTFISAFLLIMHEEWRASLNRLAEAMTLFALVNAGTFPLLHLGRPWFFYWLIPYPARTGVWPEFKSALPWDIAAITTYFLVSLMFWYLGLVPDLAVARDRARPGLRRTVYGLFALGWRGASRQWHQHRIAYLLLGGLATPLVISVHSVVSLDFASAQVPGWHSSIFPPYFVAGAIYSGFAMVVVLVLPVRRALGLERIVTERHLDNLGKLILATGLMMGYAYVIEAFGAWYKGAVPDAYAILGNRPFGFYGWLYWPMLLFNVAVPNLYWSRRNRTRPGVLLAGSIAILVGMWLERFIIVAGSLTRGYLPSSWRIFIPSITDFALLFGSLGLFAFLFLLFVRFIPVASIAETRRTVYETGSAAGHA